MTDTPRTSPSLGLALALCAASAAACGTTDYTADFAANDHFYEDVPFKTKAPGDVRVFVAPIQDQRDAALLPTHQRGFPIQYGTDAFWVRPVTEMVGDVLARQLDASEIFAGCVDQAGPDTVVMMPSLVTFAVGAKEAMAGAMTFAEVGLRVEVLGPVGADGERPRWLDEVYGHRQSTELQVQPISPYRLVGRALQVTMSSALTDLDGSNVARSSVPLARPPRSAAAAEASARRR